MKTQKNRVVAVEGFDGSGKSTIAHHIANFYGYEYHKSPSGLFGQVRGYFDNPQTPLNERLAFYIGDCIRISMLLNERKEQKFVLDRYFYSTIAYHEAKFADSTHEIYALSKLLYKPDLVFIIKSDYDTITKRIDCREIKEPNDELFLREELSNKIYENYLKIIDVPLIEIVNNGNIEEAFLQIREYL